MKKLKQQQGSALLLTLAFLALMIIPMLAILNTAGRMSTASVTANGLAATSANAASGRFIDLEASAAKPQIQLYQNNQQAADEVNMATTQAWKLSAAGATGATVQMEPLSNSSVVRVFNLPGASADNFDQIKARGSGGGCSQADGFQNGVVQEGGSILCWVDHLARDSGGGRSENRLPKGWNSDSVQQWDHYTSGAEIVLQMTFPLGWPMGNSNIISDYPGVASFSQSCANDTEDKQQGECYQ